MEEQEQPQNKVQEKQNVQMEPTPLSEPPSHKKLIIGIVAVFVLVVGVAGGIYLSSFLKGDSIPEKEQSEFGNEFQVIEYPENNLFEDMDVDFTFEEAEEVARDEEIIRRIAPTVAKETAEWLLTTKDLENLPVALEALQNEAFEALVKVTTIYIEPENREQFINNIDLRRVCVEATFVFGGDPYAVAGNSCDDESLRIAKERREAESLDYQRLSGVQILNLALELYQDENNGILTNDQTVLLEAGPLLELMTDPATGVPYEITITDDGKSYCIIAILTRFITDMQTDDGNNPNLYETGPGCSNETPTEEIKFNELPVDESTLEIPVTPVQKAVRRALAGSMRSQSMLYLEFYYNEFKVVPHSLEEFITDEDINISEKLSNLIEYERVSNNIAEICDLQYIEDGQCSRATIQDNGRMFVNNSYRDN